MRQLSAFAIVLVATTATAAPEIAVEDPGKQLTADQFTLVRQATETALARLPGTEAAKCAFRNSWRGLPTKDGWSKEMGFLRLQDKVVVTVLPEVLGPGILGMARVGSARSDGPHGRWTYVTIRLSKEKLAYWQPPRLPIWTNGRMPSPTRSGIPLASATATASSIGREAMPGYFVTELGFCVASDGQTGSDRGDLELRMKREDRFGKVVP